jgi:transcriptional regulator with XRE-family HTH domain
MKNKMTQFGTTLKSLRIKKGFSLRKICQMVHYDPSNWSKIERGRISPPSDIKMLTNWAQILGLPKKNIENFIDQALVAQGIIPQDILSQDNAINYLPAFFRTLRNKKPTKEEVDRLIELIRSA